MTEREWPSLARTRRRMADFEEADRQAEARIQARIAKAREEERRAVVNHLRATGVAMFEEMSRHNDWTAEWSSLREQGETFEEAADAIERGDHVKEMG